MKYDTVNLLYHISLGWPRSDLNTRTARPACLAMSHAVFLPARPTIAGALAGCTSADLNHGSLEPFHSRVDNSRNSVIICASRRRANTRRVAWNVMYHVTTYHLSSSAAAAATVCVGAVSISILTGVISLAVRTMRIDRVSA